MYRNAWNETTNTQYVVEIAGKNRYTSYGGYVARRETPTTYYDIEVPGKRKARSYGGHVSRRKPAYQYYNVEVSGKRKNRSYGGYVARRTSTQYDNVEIPRKAKTKKSNATTSNAQAPRKHALPMPPPTKKRVVGNPVVVTQSSMQRMPGLPSSSTALGYAPTDSLRSSNDRSGWPIKGAMATSNRAESYPADDFISVTQGISELNLNRRPSAPLQNTGDSGKPPPQKENQNNNDHYSNKGNNVLRKPGRRGGGLDDSVPSQMVAKADMGTGSTSGVRKNRMKSLVKRFFGKA